MRFMTRREAAFGGKHATDVGEVTHNPNGRI
jgi:hypothetical protein